MIITKGSLIVVADRHEVPFAGLWDDSSGSDFFFEPDAAQISGTGNAEDLSDRGWTATSLAFVAGVSANFLDDGTKGVPSHFLTDAASDLLQSPDLFGDFLHGHQAAHHLGETEPSTLTLEMWLTFSVESNNETATCGGFTDAGGSIIVATDAVATIFSDGTNFGCRSSADSDLGALADTALHLFKIVISKGTTDAIEWFIDDVSQGTLNLRTGVFPVSWGVGVVSAGSNRILIGPCRIYYR